MKLEKPNDKYLLLAEKWLNGTISPKEEKEFAEWYNKDQNNPVYIPGSFASDEKKHRQRILASINGKKQQRPTIKFINGRRPLLAFAAAILLLIALGGYFWLKTNNTINESNLNNIFSNQGRKIRNVNTAAHIKLIRLPDGSKVKLYQNSEIIYAAAYGKMNRFIYLRGEAVFEVHHNADLPFKVYVSGLITEDIGTTFRIKAYADSSDITVAVMRGIVFVEKNSSKLYSKDPGDEQKSNDGYLLKANQQIIYNVTERHMRRSLVAEPIIEKGYSSKYLQFDSAPLTEVFKHLETIYNISIIVDKSVFQHCTLSANINKGSFYDKLENICLAANLHYKEIDGHIIVSGKGCN